jgi:hypothetical protein
VNNHFNAWEIIADLHRRGFTEDFKRFENKLFWIQNKTFLNPGEYMIKERHQILDPRGYVSTIWGISSGNDCIDGILIDHSK